MAPRQWLAALVGLLALAGSAAGARAQAPPPPAETPIDFKVAFFGDSTLNEDSLAVFRLVRDEKASMVVHLGDFDYKNRPDAWEARIDEVLGKDFPFFAVIGNHDVKKWADYQANLTARAARVGAECVGPIGERSSCTYRGVQVLLMGIGTSDPSPADVAFLQEQLDRSDAVWRICAWHKPQKLLQVAPKGDGPGFAEYEACREGGAFVVNGHAHTYSRTHLLRRFEDQIIASTKPDFEMTDRTSFAVVSGLGGRYMHRQVREDPWFAAIYTEAQGASYGALFCDFNVRGTGNHAECYFKDIAGRIPDRFSFTVEPVE